MLSDFALDSIYLQEKFSLEWWGNNHKGRSPSNEQALQTHTETSDFCLQILVLWVGLTDQTPNLIPTIHPISQINAFHFRISPMFQQLHSLIWCKITNIDYDWQFNVGLRLAVLIPLLFTGSDLAAKQFFQKVQNIEVSSRAFWATAN